METSALNLLRALGLERIKVDVQPETFFQVKVESCLEMLLCCPTLLFSWIKLHILLLNSDEVAVYILLAEVLRIAHRLDEIDNVL